MGPKYFPLILVVVSGLTSTSAKDNKCTWLGFCSKNPGKEVSELDLSFTALNTKSCLPKKDPTCVLKLLSNASRNTDVVCTPGGKTVQLSIGNNSVELNWSAIENVAASGETSFAFITYNETHGIRNILYQANNQVNLALVSNIATVVSTNMSGCHISPSINLTFPQIKNTKATEVFCVRLSVKDCRTIWTEDGCEVLKVDANAITCSCNRLSTFTVLERLKSTESVSKCVSKVPAIMSNSEGENQVKQLEAMTDFLKEMEDTSMQLASDAARLGELKIKSDILEVTVQAFKIQPGVGGLAQLSTATTAVNLDWSAIKGSQKSGIASIATIVLKGAKSGMDVGLRENINKTKQTLVTDVLTVSVSSQKKGKLSSPIILHFTLTETGYTNRHALCVYWNNDARGLGWETDGCRVISYERDLVVCSCTHLTSFAALLSTYPISPAHEANLQKITYVGTALSLVCLLLSLIAFSFCRTTDNIRIIIHAHLCLSLFLAEVLFVIDFDKRAHRKACMAVAIMLHYLFLACFAWMLLEGVQLYLMVVKVFHSRSLQRKYLYLCGYGSPVVIVAITMIVNIQAYGTETHCWLSIKSGYRWAFLGPACFILGMNAFFFGITVWKLIGKFSMLSTDVPHFKKVRSFTCTAIAQLVILGGTWILGFFHFTEGTISIAYIFTTANSLQGVFIFVLHCLMSKQVRSEFLNGISKITRMTDQRTIFTRSLAVQKTETSVNTPC
ncbi:adhesion G protein-coupled receptor E5-like [Scyliorhinus canicula]|uniref:adhesion G protein-coupled receptor E5-like n=1 Tax=Scyliorhinus canicula TaxID=7830 RepID=UPI0018F45B18|nr:adhesion G protein-coupled receptor E5-like [Scyliorhinus canicula]